MVNDGKIVACVKRDKVIAVEGFQDDTRAWETIASPEHCRIVAGSIASYVYIN